MLDIKRLNLGPRHDKYLSAQRNLSIEDIPKVLASYEKYYNSIKGNLPSRCNSILDIGCGLGILDLCIYEHYHRDNDLRFYLFDKSDYEENLYFGFEENAAFYNDLQLVEEIFSNYGIANDKIITMEAENENLASLTNIDLVISSIAWGFHFPVRKYVEEVNKLMHQDSVLIMDLRKGQNGIETLQNFFNVNEILDGRKSIRVCCTKISND